MIIIEQTIKILSKYRIPIIKQENLSKKDKYVIKLSQNNPNIILVGDYLGANIKTAHKCLKHNIIWNITPGNASKGVGCKECGKEKISKNVKKTKEQYLIDLSNNCPTVKLIGDYLGADNITDFECLICGHKWKTSAQSLLRPNVIFGCPKCAANNLSLTKRYSIEQHKDMVYSINPNIEVLSSEYINNQTSISYKCKICEYIWDALPNNILRGHGCPNCAIKRNIKKSTKTNDQFILDLLEHNYAYKQGCFILLSEYIKVKSRIPCRCLICEHEWTPTADDLLAGHGCPICKSSAGEKVIKRLLNKYNISYELHKSFDNLYGINNGKLTFDFYLSTKNTLIEFQGQQHIKPIEYFGGEEQFKIQQEHDRRKRQYAKEHNINLLEIWYYDYDNIEQILSDYLNLNLESLTTVIPA